MSKVNYDESSKEILEKVGGTDNISRAYHCMTRLRLHIKDRGLVLEEELDKIPIILGHQWNGNQLQLIIGQQVGKVFESFCEISGISQEVNIPDNDSTKKHKFNLSVIFQALAAILLPVIPAIAGAGMIKGMGTVLINYVGIDKASSFITVLNIAGDCAFYFLPFLVAWSAAKYFNTNIPLAISLAGVLLYPTMTTGNISNSAAIDLFGLPIPFPRYSGSTIPIILTIWVLSYVYTCIEKVIPKYLRIVFVPTLVLLIMTPMTLVVIGPMAMYLSQFLVTMFNFLYGLSPLIAGALIGGSRMFVVMTGMHLSLSTIALGNLAEFGYDWLLPMNTMGTLALFGACLGLWIKSKNNENKQIGASTAISAFIGITEPGIYGVFLKFRTAMIATVAGGASGGAIVGLFGGRALAYVNSSILSLPVFMTDNFWCVAVGMFVSFVVACIIVVSLGVNEGLQ